MGNQLNLDYSNALDFVREEEISQLQGAVTQAHEALHNKTGAGNDFLGWVDLPADYDKEEFSRIQQAADKISGDSDVLIVIGIGGSYLGAKAALESLHHTFRNQLPKEQRKGPEIYFAGHHISPSYVNDLLHIIEGKDVSLNVISKSGLRPSLPLLFAFSVSGWKISMGKKKRRQGFMRRPTKKKEL